MASSTQLLGAHTGGSRRRVAHAGSGGGRSAAAAAAAKQLLSRLRSSLRRSAAGRRRAAVMSFGYDMQSYSRNFDDGLGSSVGRHPLSVIPCNC
ncbi:hypothetical protein C2845_PM01G40700 [Panicum miliaceum]|uniref:Uncharacterized protein n=1 Tax=Panicum miliaceum TaxID=4540 RepID=A0A3L6TNX0_PANMI|nr:hypothetical protein C2845_PM01G40700 [Panicum miliaceum]